MEKGSEIGKSGTTGNSTGPHLHLEVRTADGRVDPMKFLQGSQEPLSPKESETVSDESAPETQDAPLEEKAAEAEYFSRVGTDLITHLAQLSSIGRELDIASRLQIFRDFFKGNEPAAFAFDLKEHMQKGHSFKDWLCPDSMEFHKDHFRLNDRWGRVLYLQDYASYIKDSMIAELCDMDRSLMLSIDILTVPTDEAVREIQNKLLGVETNAANWQRSRIPWIPIKIL